MIHHATHSASSSSCSKALAAMPGTVRQIMEKADMPFATVHRACKKMAKDGIVFAAKSTTRDTVRSRWPLVYTPAGLVAKGGRIDPMSQPTYKPPIWATRSHVA